MIADKLREAKALIERGWTQGADARDAALEDCDPRGEEAVCFCINGALCGAGISGREADRADRLINRAIGLPEKSDEYLEWNDAPERTQAEVLAAFDKAIALAEAVQ